MANILVVDDELGIRDLLSEILNDEGHHVELAENAAQARALRSRIRPDLVLLDIWMPDTDGVTLLKEWSVNGLLTMPVIMMSGHATIDTAVEATRIGAIAFLEKPITLQKLLKTVEQALTKPSMRRPLLQGSSNPAIPSNPGVASSYAGTGGMGAFAAGGVNTASPPGFNASDMANATAAHTSQNEHTADSNTMVYANAAYLGPQATQNFLLEKPLRDARDEFEKAYFEFHLAKEGGSMTRVAEKTGLERTHLYRKLKQLGVDLTRGKRGNTSTGG